MRFYNFKNVNNIKNIIYNVICFAKDYSLRTLVEGYKTIWVMVKCGFNKMCASQPGKYVSLCA